MSRFVVTHPSIGRAVRSGLWKFLGRQKNHGTLLSPAPLLQWSVGTIEGSVWLGPKVICATAVADPKIRDSEVIAGWDAEPHLPARLKSDFGDEGASEFIGGIVHRERKLNETMARKFPEQPVHQLPAKWVHT
jgi:hypothetical protein